MYRYTGMSNSHLYPVRACMTTVSASRNAGEAVHSLLSERDTQSVPVLLHGGFEQCTRKVRFSRDGCCRQRTSIFGPQWVPRPSLAAKARLQPLPIGIPAPPLGVRAPQSTPSCIEGTCTPHFHYSIHSIRFSNEQSSTFLFIGWLRNSITHHIQYSSAGKFQLV